MNNAQEIERRLAEKKMRPTVPIEINSPWDEDEIFKEISGLLKLVEKVNSTFIIPHNDLTRNFQETQLAARENIRRYYAFHNLVDYTRHENDVAEAQSKTNSEKTVRDKKLHEAQALRAKISQHSSAAEQVNNLIEAYLGHSELRISAVENGYEIHRHGKPIKGAPSEGEKTAIALCYFLSTLDSATRRLKDLVVAVDDPISSLDTRALNYSCSLLNSRLNEAKQVFILTHSHQCTNEFKKAWRRHWNREKDPEASLLFLDVRMNKDTRIRQTSIVKLSKFLREYDFEYHYLFDLALKYEAAGDQDFEYAYMMPNVMRRILDVFLSFRRPGSSGFSEKMKQLTQAHPDLNKIKLIALERLTQVESHSDSLDDLIAFSSMTIEEAAEANKTLLAFINIVDAPHLKAMRKLCG